MTPERIAELKAKRDRAVALRAPFGSMVVDIQDVDALLAECERPWTAELPKESGWYWRTYLLKPEGQEIVWVDHSLEVFAVASERGVSVSNLRGSLWSGPLSPPQQAGAQP